MFKIDVSDMNWLNGVGDDPHDLCAHGKVLAVIGDERFEYNGIVSATALRLLKSLTEDHFSGESGKQMIPCCGHFLIPNDTFDRVEISGCDGGIDWTIIHNDDGKIKLITQTGKETTVCFDEYEKEVFEFADKVEKFYKSCTPKDVPQDDFDRKGYLSFWTEWYKRRYSDKTIAKQIKPDFYKKHPKDIRQHMRAIEFEEKHPQMYKALQLIGIFVMILPSLAYILLETRFFDAPNSPLLLLGWAGAFCVGIAAFGVVAAWMKQYPGHVFTVTCCCLGVFLVVVSHIFLFK
ncbi:MAG: hypothetical protein IJW15_00030 [Clostridia bacterium]|nr:hypothetical protein [Clostridia bacterium]